MSESEKSEVDTNTDRQTQIKRLIGILESWEISESDIHDFSDDNERRLHAILSLLTFDQDVSKLSLSNEATGILQNEINTLIDLVKNEVEDGDVLQTLANNTKSLSDENEKIIIGAVNAEYERIHDEYGTLVKIKNMTSENDRKIAKKF